MTLPAETLPAETLHATCVVLGEQGVLIMGASGQGKSALALALLARARASGQHARLVGDDRVIIHLAGGRVIGRGHARIRGLIEARGTGILSREIAEEAVISAVVTLEPGPERLPPAEAGRLLLLGVPIRRLVLPADRDLPAKADLVFSWLAP